MSVMELETEKARLARNILNIDNAETIQKLKSAFESIIYIVNYQDNQAVDKARLEESRQMLFEKPISKDRITELQKYDYEEPRQYTTEELRQRIDKSQQCVKEGRVHSRKEADAFIDNLIKSLEISVHASPSVSDVHG